MNPGSTSVAIPNKSSAHRSTERRERFCKLEDIGRIRLSEHFYLRDFLYSEIAITYGILNIPDNLDLATKTGTRLCQEILEPLITRFGPIHIRSGFRSARTNELGARLRLNCARNQKNFGYHIWDQRDHLGNAGAAACVVIPWLVDHKDEATGREWMARYVYDHLPYHRLTFFKRNFAFNIGSSDTPQQDIYSYFPNRKWLVKNGVWLN